MSAPRAKAAKKPRTPKWVGSYVPVNAAMKRRDPEWWAEHHPTVWSEWKGRAYDEHHRIYAAYGGDDPPEMGYPSMMFAELMSCTERALDSLTGRGPKMTALDVQCLIAARRDVAEYQRQGAPFTLEEVFAKLGLPIPQPRRRTPQPHSPGPSIDPGADTDADTDTDPDDESADEEEPG